LPVASKCQEPSGNWQLTTGNFLSLLLLVLCIRADDPHDAFAADDLAIFADPPDAASNFHGLIFLFSPNRPGDRRIGKYSVKSIKTQVLPGK
jgi:hypothetical protein